MERIFAEISIGALRHNAAMIRKRADGAALCAVVKADGYGHGAVRTARALEDADMLAVATPGEARELRENGMSAPLLVLGSCPPELAPEMAARGVSLTLYDAGQARDISAALAHTSGGRALGVHVKLDTGFSRLGFPINEEGLSGVCASLRLPGFRADAAFTHFATDDAFIPEQYSRFRGALNALKSAGCEFPLLHCANSAAVVQYPETYVDMVRPGLLLYGYSSTRCRRCGSDRCLGLDPCGSHLIPAMRLRAPVAQIKTLRAGDTVGYDRTFTAPAPMRIATVAAGYADGVPRALSNRGSVMIRGQEAPIVGRVCMDMFMTDVSEISAASPGDTAVLFGPDEGECRLDAWTQAACIGTIPHELISGLTRRVERVDAE